MSKKFVRTTSGVAGGAAVMVTVAAASLALTATGAAAATDDSTRAKGRVIAQTSLAEHTAPSVSAPIAGDGYKKGKVISIDCKLDGSNVGGNDRWYKVHDQKSWVSARYVENIGDAPIECTKGTSSESGKTTAVLSLREGPTTKDARTGEIGKNKSVDLWCKVKSQSVSGDKTWYLTGDDGWVAGAYVKTSAKVSTC